MTPSAITLQPSFDLTERKRTEAAMLEMNRDLTQSRQQLRRLVALNETRLEQEKQHIAREVHDELGQVLTALRLGLSLTVMRHASLVPELVDELHGLKKHWLTEASRVCVMWPPVCTPLHLTWAWLLPSSGWPMSFRDGEALCQVKVPDETIALEPSCHCGFSDCARVTHQHPQIRPGQPGQHLFDAV